MKRNVFRKVVSLLLSFTMLVSLETTAVWAAERLPVGHIPQTVQDPKEKAPPPASKRSAPVELEQYRSANSKRFLNPDGSLTEQIYSEPIYYKNAQSGKWEPIDSSLVQGANGSFHNKANRFAVALNAKANQGEMSVSQDGATLSFQPTYATAATAEKKSENRLEYAGVTRDTDLTYAVQPNGLKESLLLKSANAPTTFSYQLNLQNLTYKTEADGSITFTKPGATEKTFQLAKPFMVDANQNRSNEVSYQIKKDTAGHLVLSVVIDPQWLHATDRAYPVVVDPTITVQNGGVSNVDDTFVSSKNPDDEFADFSTLYVGYSSNSFYTTRSLFWFNLASSLPSGAVISSATLNVYNSKAYVSDQAPVVEAHRVTSAWSGTGIGWSNQPTIGGIDGQITAPYTAPAMWNIPITSLVQDWYNGTQANYGVELKFADESRVCRELIATDNTSDVAHHPSLTVNYTVDGLGDQPFWTYDGPVNMGNRNLMLPEQDIEFPGRGVALNLGRTYNSRSKNSGVFGYGWSSPLDIHLYSTGYGPARLVDGSGTTHFFAENSDGSYDSPPGLYWNLGYTNATTALLTTTDGTEYTFANGQLTQIKDASGNVLTYTRNSSGQVTAIKDPAGHTIMLSYFSNGKLYSATDPANRTWYYGYDTNGNLFKVTSPDGKAELYRYDANHNLVASVTPAGRTTYYAYTADDRLVGLNPLNGVTNGNFEVDADGDAVPDHFNYSSGQTDQGVVVQNTGSPYGQAFRINTASTNATPYTIFLSDPISVDPTKTYTLSGYMKQIQGGTGYSVLSLIALDANGANLGEFGRTQLSAGSDWKQVAATMAAGTSTGLPTGTVNVEIKLAASSSTGAANNYWDGVQLEEGSTATTFVSGDQFTADPANSRAARYDGEGHKQLYTYNAMQNITHSQQDPSGLNISESFTWDANIPNTLSKHTNANGNAWTFAHDTNSGNLLKVTDPYNHTESYAWDGKSNLTQYTNVNNDAYKNSYDTGSNTLTSRDPYQTSTAQWHDAYGNISRETNALGVADNLIDNSSFEEGVNADGTPVNFQYDSGMQAYWAIRSDAVNGTHSVTIASDASNASSYSVLVSKPVPVDIAADYVLAGDLKATETAAKSQHTVLSVYAYSDAAGTTLLGELGRIDLIGASDWRRWSEVIHAGEFPSGTVSVRVKLGASNGSAYGNAYFDAIQLQKNPVDTAYNLLDNPSFERGSSWPDGWTQPPDGQWATSGAYAGTHNLAIVKPAAHEEVSTNNWIPYNSAKSYSLSAYYKGTGIGSSNWVATIKIEEYDGNYKYLGSIASPNQGDSDWKHLSVDLPAGGAIAGTAYLRPALTSEATSGTLSFDAIRLQEGSVSTVKSYDSSNTWVTKSTDPLGNSTQYAHDAAGNTTEQTDPLGNVTVSSYDAMDRLLSTTPRGNDVKISYSYDADGNMTSVTTTDPSGATVYNQSTIAYNALNQPTTVTDPLGRQTTYSYTPAGRLREVSSATGKVSATYDQADRVTDMYLNGIDRYQFGYDPNGNVTSTKDLTQYRTWTATYDKLDRLTSWSDGTGTIAYTLDANGNVTQEQLTAGTVTKKQTATYNKVDQTSTLTDADGKTSEFLFDENGKLSLVQSGNGVAERLTYDNANRGTGVRNETSDGTLISSYQYKDASGKTGLDADGRILAITDQTGKTLNYTYTVKGQLKTETLPNGNTVTYSYDPLGNRTQRQETKPDGTTASTISYQYDKANELTQVDSTALTYDGNGNLTSDGTYSYKWDASNRLIEVDTVATGTAVATYQYDAVGRRVQQTVDGQVTNFLYDGKSNRVVAEFDGNNNLTKWYTWGPTGQLLSLTVNGTTYYTVRNAHGDIVQLTDVSGAVVATYTYDAWGNQVDSTGGTIAAQNPYRYAGYRFDDATGLYYLNSRYYNPAVGRFISLEPESNTPDYVYASNNPLSYVDLTGHWLLDIGFLVADTLEYMAAPSVEGAVFIGIDIVSTIIPVGSVSIIAHAARAIDRAAHLYETARELGEIDRVVGHAGEAAHYGSGGAHAGDGSSATIRENGRRAAANYTISRERFGHVVTNHRYDTTVTGKGKFQRNFAIKKAIREAVSNDSTRISANTNGREGFIFEYKYPSPRTIGTDKYGRTANGIRVVLGKAGNVITAFPIKMK